MNRPFAALAAWVLLVSASPPPSVDDALIAGDTLPAKLSEFHLLSGRYGEVPNAGVTPYRLNTPLFSDYAEKFRFYYVPPGRKIGWRDDGALDFPLGSVLIKSFGSPPDMRAPARELRILETRLLVRRPSGWVALPYVWNADGSDAELKRAGLRIDVRWIHLDGKPRAISYAVPNVNQCKGCHDDGAGGIGLIGPKARNLNRDGQNLLQQQGRVVAELQNGLMRTRMVPFQRHVQRLTRLVRQAAQEADKKVELVIEGGSGELDRQVLERMLPPF